MAIKQYAIIDGKLQTASGTKVLDGFTPFTTTFTEDGTEVFPVEMQPYLEAEALQAEQSEFRANRNLELNTVDILINKAEDNSEDTTALRAYRQALRDATVDWVMPTLEG